MIPINYTIAEAFSNGLGGLKSYLAKCCLNNFSISIYASVILEASLNKVSFDFIHQHKTDARSCGSGARRSLW